jgi:predicted transposase YbfD/YdcC
MQEFGEIRLNWFRKWITLPNGVPCEKSNEITAIPELLKMLNLQGAVVTLDAMGTQREIATKIVEKHGDYILCVKGNLHKEMSDHFEFAARQLGCEKLDPANWSHAETLARSHGRNERRQTIACHYLEWMDADIRSAWTGLDTLFREDHNHTRQKNSAKNHSTMRRIAHNTHKCAPDPSRRKRPSSLPKKQLRAAQTKPNSNHASP